MLLLSIYLKLIRYFSHFLLAILATANFFAFVLTVALATFPFPRDAKGVTFHVGTKYANFPPSTGALPPRILSVIINLIL